MSDLDTVAVPVTIHTKRRGDFIVPDVGAWTYQELGVFATGHWGWDDEKKERDVLISYDSIEFIEFDFDALINFEVEELIEEATSDDVPRP